HPCADPHSSRRRPPALGGDGAGTGAGAGAPGCRGPRARSRRAAPRPVIDTPHLPRPVPIDAYGKGGFRFAAMSHHGSLLCLPSGIWAWPPPTPADIDVAALAPAFAEAAAIDLFLLGTGAPPWSVPADLPWELRALHMAVH